MEVIYIWQIMCKRKQGNVHCRKENRKHRLSLLQLLLVKGKAKCPHTGMIQRRRTHENDPCRTQSKISRNCGDHIIQWLKTWALKSEKQGLHSSFII